MMLKKEFKREKFLIYIFEYLEKFIIIIYLFSRTRFRLLLFRLERRRVLFMSSRAAGVFFKVEIKYPKLWGATVESLIEKLVSFVISGKHCSFRAWVKSSKLILDFSGVFRLTWVFSTWRFGRFFSLSCDSGTMLVVMGTSIIKNESFFFNSI